MGNVVEMNPVHVLDEKMKAKVLESGKRLDRNGVALRKLSQEIAWDAAFVEHLAGYGSWGVLGYKDQHAFRLAKGFSRSNWYRLIAIGLKFQELSREDYLKMKVENAERLGLEDPAVRYDAENLKAAVEMKIDQFDDYLVTKGAHREGKSKQEHWCEMKFRMRDEQRKVIEEGLQGWMKEHEITDSTYAFELLVAEYRDRDTLTGFFLKSIPKLTSKIKETDDPSALKLTLADHVIEMQKVLDRCCGEVEDIPA